jgi:cytochrome bd-type quinol oxidase subunit 1
MKEYLRLFKLGFMDNLVKVSYVVLLLMIILAVVMNRWEDLLLYILIAILQAPLTGIVIEWGWYKDLINKDLDAIIQELEIDEQP